MSFNTESPLLFKHLSPCPSRFSSSKSPSSCSSCPSEPRNPFDEDLVERLRHSAFSPTFGGGGHIDANQQDGEDDRPLMSPFTVAVMNPVDIDEKHVRRQSRMKSDPETDRQVQKSIEFFFQNKQLTNPSPISCASVASYSELERVSFEARGLGMDLEREENTIEEVFMVEQQTQTELSIPSHVDLLSILGMYFTEQSTNEEPLNSDRVSCSSPYREHSNVNGHSIKMDSSGLFCEDSVYEDLGTDHADQQGVNSRSSSMAEMDPSLLCVSPILPVASSSNSPLHNKLLISPSSTYQSPSELFPKFKSSLSPITRLTNSSPNVSAIEPNQSLASTQFDADQPLNSSHGNNPQSDSRQRDGIRDAAVRFLSFTTVSDEFVVDNARDENSEEIFNSSPVRSADDRDRTSLIEAGAGRSGGGGFESTRQISFEDAAMISIIPHPNDTLALTATEDSGIAANSNVQQFAPVLSSTHIGAHVTGHASDSGIAQVTQNMLSNSSINAHLSSVHEVNENNIAVLDVETTTPRRNSSNDIEAVRIRTNYREPVADTFQVSPSASVARNLSFVVDELSRDQIENNERAALDRTSAAIRNQFADFEIFGSPSRIASQSLQPVSPQKVGNGNIINGSDSTPIPGPKSKLARFTKTPDLSSFDLKLTGQCFDSKSLNKEERSSALSRELFNQTAPQSQVATTSILKRSRDNTKENFSLAGKNIESKSNAEGFFVRDTAPFIDRTNQMAFKSKESSTSSSSVVSSTTSQPQRSLKDLLNDNWWTERCNKHEF